MIGTYQFNETSPAVASTVASSNPVSGGPSDMAAGVASYLGDYDSIEVVAELIGATGGTLDVYVQSNDTATGTWYDAIHFAQLGAGASAVRYRTSLSRHATSAVAPTVIGKDLTPALAAATSIQNGFGDRVRLVMVAGTSTSAGAAVSVRITGFRSETRR